MVAAAIIIITIITVAVSLRVLVAIVIIVVVAEVLLNLQQQMHGDEHEGAAQKENPENAFHRRPLSQSGYGVATDNIEICLSNVLICVRKSLFDIGIEVHHTRSGHVRYVKRFTKFVFLPLV